MPFRSRKGGCTLIPMHVPLRFQKYDISEQLFSDNVSRPHACRCLAAAPIKVITSLPTVCSILRLKVLYYWLPWLFFSSCSWFGPSFCAHTYQLYVLEKPPWKPPQLHQCGINQTATFHCQRTTSTAPPSCRSGWNRCLALLCFNRKLRNSGAAFFTYLYGADIWAILNCAAFQVNYVLMPFSLQCPG